MGQLRHYMPERANTENIVLIVLYMCLLYNKIRDTRIRENINSIAIKSLRYTENMTNVRADLLHKKMSFGGLK